MDTSLRTALWNFVYEYASDNWSHEETINISYELWIDFWKGAIDEFKSYTHDFYDSAKQSIYHSEWWVVYDWIEFVFGGTDAEGDINSILNQNMAGYRFVDDQISPVVSDAEIKEIENALEQPLSSGIQTHLKRALELLADRQNPDYRNSIKESISAVESLVQRITGQSKAPLGKALKKIEERIPIHPSLKVALDKMYGYTNDSDGVRHAMQDEASVDVEDAKFMLVTCSAFVNYLIAKCTKAGIDLNNKPEE